MTFVQGTTMIAELTAIRSRVRQHHSQIATVLLDNLIRKVECKSPLEAKQPVTVDAIISGRVTPTALLSQPSVKAMRKATNGKVPNGRCPYARYTQAGNLLKRQRHHCTPACTWTAAEVSEWLRTTPYPGFTTPPRLVPVPPCVNCTRRRSDHWEAVTNADGFIRGFREIKECSYAAA